MTTIAYRDGVLAADTGMSMGCRNGRTTKIARNNAGDLAGAAGDACYAAAFRKWFVGGEIGEPPEGKEDTNCIDRAVIFRHDGTIEVFEPRGRFEITAPYYAFGSGKAEALGAMFAGGDATTAVKAAIEHDEYTFGEVSVLRHAGGSI